MISILFLVGKDIDLYPYKTNSKRAPLWLSESAFAFKEFINDDKTVPSDVAMAMYISYHHPKDNISCKHAIDVRSKIELDIYDVIYVIYDAIEIFYGACSAKTCDKERNRFNRILKNTSAFVYPYPKFHNYIINKPYYYSDLKRAGLPIAPFFKATPQSVLKDVSAFRKKVRNKGWDGIIIKPSYAGYSMGIKVLKNFSQVKDSTIRRDFEFLKDNNFSNATIQEYIPTFGKNFEIRTYWLNGKYAFAIGTLTKKVEGGTAGLPIDDEDTFVSEGGTIPDKIKKRLKELGLQVQKALPQYSSSYPQHPMIRIDFGCCLSEFRDCEDTYFINEVETMACNLLSEHTDYPVVEKTAQALYSFAKKVKGKKEPTPYKSTYYAESIPCIPSANA